MNFGALLAEFDSEYKVVITDNPLTPEGPMLSQMFKMPEYARAASEIQRNFPYGIYLMFWKQESLLPDDLGSVFFVRFRGIK